MIVSDQADWARAVIEVGDGRGFVVGSDDERFVITDWHCLRWRPSFRRVSFQHERTFKLLAPIAGQRSVYAECLFADLVSDLAVLGSPDDQALKDEAQAFEALVNRATPLSIANIPLVRPRSRSAAAGCCLSPADRFRAR